MSSTSTREPRRKRPIHRAIHRMTRWPRPFGPMVRGSFDLFHLLRIEVYARLNKLRSPTVEGDPFGVIMVDPRKIEHLVLGIAKVPGATWKNVGRVLGGDWDYKLRPFSSRTSYRSLSEHFEQGVPWEDTEYYACHTYRIDEGHVRWGCVTREEFAERCRGVDALFDAIRLDGYKQQRDLLKARRGRLSLAERRQLLDEVVICIGRHGELLFADGQHRLSIARILGLSHIPVRVLIRHAEWEAFRRRIESWARKEEGGILCHALPHPDLRFIPTNNDSEAWAAILATRLGASTGRLLEVGAGVSGYFSSFFADRGWACFAMETDPVRRDVLRDIRDTTGRSYRIVDELAVEGGRMGYFDVVLHTHPVAAADLGAAVFTSAPLLARGRLFIPVLEAGVDLESTVSDLCRGTNFSMASVTAVPATNSHLSIVEMYHNAEAKGVHEPPAVSIATNLTIE